MYGIYSGQNSKNEIIENKWKDYAHRKLPINFQTKPSSNFTKQNAFESLSYPSCMVFDTDIVTWKHLKDVIGNN